MSSPYFTIVIPAFNRAEILKQTIQLTLDQTFENFELIIADDGSIDDTNLVVKNFNDHRIKYFHQSNKGVCAARNMGAENATGKFIIFLDSDDHIQNNWLKDFHSSLISKNADIAFCAVKLQHANNFKIINPEDPYHNKKDWGVFLAGAFALKLELFLKIGMYDANVHFGENTELGYRIKKEKIIPAFIHSINLVYKPSPGGGSKNLQNRIDSNLYILAKHKDWFADRPSSKKFYLQTAGIASYKLNKRKDAKKLLIAAWKLKPFNATALARIIFLNIPFVAKKLWKPKLD